MQKNTIITPFLLKDQHYFLLSRITVLASQVLWNHYTYIQEIHRNKANKELIPQWALWESKKYSC